MFLIDTNIISEARKGLRANPGVRSFLQQADDASLFLSVISIGEIRCGIASLQHRGDLPQAALLDDWLQQLCQDFGERILPFDLDCAQLWGMLLAPHRQHPVDRQLAATALIYDLTLVTRNTADFAGLPVRLLNPFSSN